MSALRRISVVWSGVPGSPYLSTFIFSSASSQGPALGGHVATFLNAIKNLWCPPLGAQIQQQQEIFDEETGTLLDVESFTSSSLISGTGSGEVLPYATQGVLKLGTATIVNGRRLQGRLFIPCPPENQSSGIPASLYTTPLQGAGAALITNSATAGPWSVWSRPVPAGGTRPPRAGTHGVITSAFAWDKWGVLRKRRD